MLPSSQHNFGSGGKETFNPELTTTQFCQSWSYDGAYHSRVNKRGVKTLTHRSSEPREWRNHSPIFSRNKTNLVHPVNGSGQPIKGHDLTRDIKSLSSPDYGFKLVQLNHYAIRSAEAFLLKACRGNANHVNAAYGLKYWRKYDQGRTTDSNIQRFRNDLEEQKKEFLEDPELAALEMEAIDLARKQIHELRRSPAGAQLLRRIQRYRRRNFGTSELLK